MKKLFLVIIVLLGFIACDDIIEVPDISKETITVLAPTNGSAVDTTLVNFSWQVLKDAETYQIQVATPTFSEASQILVDTIVVATGVSKILSVNNFEWRVKGLNSSYETVYVTQSFSVVGKD